MASFKLLTGDAWRWSVSPSDHGRGQDSLSASSIIDYVGIELGGRELAAAACEEHLPALIGGLMDALQRLWAGERKCTLSFRSAPRELVLARQGHRISLSLLALGNRPDLILDNLAVRPSELIGSVLDECGKLLRRVDELDPRATNQGWARRLAGQRQRLARLRFGPMQPANRRRSIGPEEPLELRCEQGGAAVSAILRPHTWLRTYRAGDGRDMHSLLFPGAVEVLLSRGEARTHWPRSGPPMLALMELNQQLESGLRQGGAGARLRMEDGRHDGELRGDELLELAEAAAGVMRQAVQKIRRLYAHHEANRALRELAAYGDALMDLAEGRRAAATAGYADKPRPVRRPLELEPEPEDDDARFGDARRIIVTPRWRAQGAHPVIEAATSTRVVLTQERDVEVLDVATGRSWWRRDGHRGAVLAGDVVVSWRPDGVMVGLELESGRDRFELPASPGTEPRGAEAGAISRDGRALLVDAGGGRIRCLRLPDGALLWEQDFETEQRLLPVWADGVPVVAAEGGEVWGLSPDGGPVQWRRRALGAVKVAPRMLGDRLLVATGEGDLPGGGVMLLDPQRGTTHWERHLGLAVDRPVAAAPGLLLAASRVEEYATVVALDPDTGETLWRREVEYLGVSGLAAPLLTRGVAVIKSDDHRLLGLEPSTGRTLWSVDLEGERCLEVLGNVDPLAYGGVVLVAADTLYVLNPFTGQVLRRVPPASCPVPSRLRLLDTPPRPSLLVEDGERAIAAFTLSYLAVL